MSANTRIAGPPAMPPLDWLRDALGRDRSNVLVLSVAPEASSVGAGEILAEALGGSLEVVAASLVGVGPDAALARVLDEPGAPGPADLEARLQRKLQDLSQRGSGLVLALSEAGAIPAATLRRLGVLASASRQGLRLALFVDCPAADADVTAAALVRDLGVGVEKFLVGAAASEGLGARPVRPSVGAPPVVPASVLGPPRIDAEPGRKPRGEGRRLRGEGPIRVRARSHRANGRLRIAVGALVAVAAALAWRVAPLSDPGDTADSGSPGRAPTAALAFAPTPPPVSAPTPDPPGRGVALPEPPPRAGVAVAPEAVSFAPESPEPDRRERESSEPGSSEGETHETPEPTRSEPAPAPVRPPLTVRINLNADPWAHIELDGRPVGSTPLADLPVEIGSHRIVVRFPDGDVLERSVEIDEFQRYLRFP